MVRGLQVATFSLVMLALATSTASSQHAREHPLNIGLGFSFSGFGNPPIVLNEDCVAVISEGFQFGASLSDGGLLVMSGLSSGLVNFQFLTWGGVVPPFTTLTRRTFKLSESSVVYMGTAEWDGGNGHLIVFNGIGSGGAPDVTLHANLDENLWPKGWGVPLVFDPQTMVLPAPGPDRWLGTGDDILVVCQGLGTPWFQASSIGLGSGLGSTLTMLPSGLGVTVAAGGDGVRGTNDDILVTIRFVAGRFR